VALHEGVMSSCHPALSTTDHRSCYPGEELLPQLILGSAHLEGVGYGQENLLRQQSPAGRVEVPADRTTLGAYPTVHAEQVSVLALHRRRRDGHSADRTLDKAQDALQDEGQASQTRGHGGTADALRISTKDTSVKCGLGFIDKCC